MSREERRAQTRRRLLDAAADVFARRGFHGASVEEIAAQAAFTQGALYANFAGKEELFLAVIDDRMAGQRAAVSDRLDDPDDRAGQAGLREHAEQQLAQQAEGGHVDLLLLLEFLLHAVRDRPDLRQGLADRYRAADELMAREVARRRGRESDAGGLSDEQVALAHSALIQGLGLRMLLDPHALTPQQAASLLEQATHGAASA